MPYFKTPLPIRSQENAQKTSVQTESWLVGHLGNSWLDGRIDGRQVGRTTQKHNAFSTLRQWHSKTKMSPYLFSCGESRHPRQSQQSPPQWKQVLTPIPEELSANYWSQLAARGEQQMGIIIMTSTNRKHVHNVMQQRHNVFFTSSHQ